eukprot:2503421-Amphidinium_carterae.1
MGRSTTTIYITAFRDRDEEKMKKICYKYFEGHNELRRQWKKQKIEETLKKENSIRKTLLREKERHNKKRENEKNKKQA